MEHCKVKCFLILILTNFCAYLSVYGSKYRNNHHSSLNLQVFDSVIEIYLMILFVESVPGLFILANIMYKQDVLHWE